jgi:hypothetical protein
MLQLQGVLLIVSCAVGFVYELVLDVRRVVVQDLLLVLWRGWLIVLPSRRVPCRGSWLEEISMTSTAPLCLPCAASACVSAAAHRLVAVGRTVSKKVTSIPNEIFLIALLPH